MKYINNGFKILKPCLPNEKRHIWNLETRTCYKCNQKFDDISFRIKRDYKPRGRPIGRPMGSKNMTSNVFPNEKGSSIIEERNRNPCATLQQIGDKFGVTRERVRQILERSNLPTKHFVQKYKCNQCGETIKGNGKLFCSRECLEEYYNVNLICDWCGKTFTRKQHDIKISLRRPLGAKGEKLWFCDYKCHGKWLGQNYGFKHGHKFSQKKKPLAFHNQIS